MSDYTTWKTIAISPLPPGWVVVVEGSNGTLHPWPCPALLLQEEAGGDPDYPPDYPTRHPCGACLPCG